MRTATFRPRSLGQLLLALSCVTASDARSHSKRQAPTQSEQPPAKIRSAFTSFPLCMGATQTAVKAVSTFGMRWEPPRPALPWAQIARLRHGNKVVMLTTALLLTLLRRHWAGRREIIPLSGTQTQRTTSTASRSLHRNGLVASTPRPASAKLPDRSRGIPRSCASSDAGLQVLILYDPARGGLRVSTHPLRFRPPS